YSLKSGRLIPPVPFFFLRITLAIRGFLYFHTNCEIIRSSSTRLNRLSSSSSSSFLKLLHRGITCPFAG
ncbi:unnamed protein product, partial [Rangifer tarandus platyrhynchus]